MSAIPTSKASYGGENKKEARRPVTSKIDFARRYRLGEFGNASPTWDSWRDWWLHVSVLIEPKTRVLNRSRYADTLYHLRSKVASEQRFARYNVFGHSLCNEFGEMVRDGAHPDSLYVSEMAPTEKTLFQGEVRQSERHVDLTYTTVAKPMREALAERTEHANGLRALGLLKRYLCPKSLEWLNYLLDTYEDHVIEFSTFSVEWGTIPGYNSVFWEVRLY